MPLRSAHTGRAASITRHFCMQFISRWRSRDGSPGVVYSGKNCFLLPMGDAIRIAVFGFESTGKTTLAETLAAKFRVPLVAEYAREFWDQHGGIGLEDMMPIAREQWRREDEA